MRGLAAALLLAPLTIGGGIAHAQSAPEPPPPSPPPGASAALAQNPDDGIAWRTSYPVGRTNRGWLVGGVQLPAEGTDFFTWDPVLGGAPNRPWRRWGADTTLRVTLRVLAEYRAAHPFSPRVGVGDISRPNGGPFGRRYGGLGHASHQNGLDVDLYYPRWDTQELPPSKVSQIDRELSQDLVNRFVAAGAVYVFVGPRTRLRGPKPVVEPLVNHDDHIHVRFRPGAR